MGRIHPEGPEQRSGKQDGLRCSLIPCEVLTEFPQGSLIWDSCLLKRHFESFHFGPETWSGADSSSSYSHFLLLLPLTVLKNLYLPSHGCLIGPGTQNALFWSLGLSPGSSSFEVQQILDKDGSVQRILVAPFTARMSSF